MYWKGDGLYGGKFRCKLGKFIYLKSVVLEKIFFISVLFLFNKLCKVGK